MRICFGANVVGQGGEEVGQVARLIIASETLEATHVVVGAGRRRAVDQGRSWLVPLSMVQGATDQQLLLHLTAAQLAQMPQFVPGTLMATESMAGGQQAREAESCRRAPQPRVIVGDEQESRALAERHVSVALGRDCAVEALDGRLGPLAGVRLDLYTNRLASIIVDRGVLFERQLDVPATWISEVSPRRITLATTSQQAAQIVGPEAGPYLAVKGEEEAGGGGAR